MGEAASNSTIPWEERLREVESYVLDILFRHYPKGLNVEHSTRTAQLMGSGQSLKAAFSEVIAFTESRLAGIGAEELDRLLRAVVENLDEAGMITVERVIASGADWARITSAGIEELSRRRGSAFYADVQEIRRIVMEELARVARAIEANEARQGELTKGMDAFEQKLMKLERDFYSRIFPFFAVFVAAFALIITGALNAIRLVGTGTAGTRSDWLQLLLETLSIMGTITVLLLLFVWATWLLTRSAAEKWLPGGAAGRVA